MHLHYTWLQELIVSIPSSTRLTLHAWHLKSLARLIRSPDSDMKPFFVPHLVIAGLVCEYRSDYMQEMYRDEWKALLDFLSHHHQNGQKIHSLSLISDFYDKKHLTYTAEAQSLVDQFSDSRRFSYESLDDDASDNATDDASDNEEG
jgi:hypothetical protein